MNVEPEAVVGRYLRDWLLMQLPAKCAAINATRSAVLRAPYAGPYEVPANRTLAFCLSPVEESFTACPLTAGTRSAAQVAADINAVVPGLASADSAGRLVITALLSPIVQLASIVRLRGSVPADINTLFGWDPGGERSITTALVAPSAKGVSDGLPLFGEMGPRGNGANGAVVIVIGDKHAKPVLPQRTDQHLVSVDVSVFRIEPQQQVHRNREHIYAALQCVREVLLTQQGLMLGRAGQGDIQKVTEVTSAVAAQPFAFAQSSKSPPEWMSDGASLQLEVRVYARPAQSSGAVVVTPSALAFDDITLSGQLTAAQVINGASIDATGIVTWSSLNTSVATVSAAGLVTRTGPGSTTIQATFDGWQTGTATVTAE